MKDTLKYSSTIKTVPFLYIELKKVASLHLAGVSEAEIRGLAIQENLFQVNSENRKKEIARTVLRRLNSIDDFLTKKLVQGSLETSKLIALYSILHTDRLFFEFMNEVFKDKVQLGDLSLTDKDFSVFFQRKAEQSETVAAWKDYTYYKLQQVYIRILYEAGLLKNRKGEREIILPLIDEDVLQHLRSTGNGIYLEVLGVK